MTLKEKLKLVEDKLSVISISMTDKILMESERSDLKETGILWSEINSEIQEDFIKARQVEIKIIEMIEAFEKNNNLKGRKIAWEISHMFSITELK
jgi:hypothetical protein